MKSIKTLFIGDVDTGITVAITTPDPKVCRNPSCPNPQAPPMIAYGRADGPLAGGVEVCGACGTPLIAK